MSGRLPMHAFWQGGGSNRRERDRRGTSISDGDPRIALLKDVSGGELSDSAVKRLLSRHDGDVEAAANTFFQMSTQDGMIQSMNEEAEEDESYSVSLPLPQECYIIQEPLSWVSMQCESIGYAVKLTLQPPSPESTQGPRLEFDATDCLSTSPTQLRAAPPETVTVKLHSELVKNIIRRDRERMIATGGVGSDIKLATVASEILSICSVNECCTISPLASLTPATATTSSNLVKQLQASAKYIYRLTYPNGETWHVPPAILKLLPQNEPPKASQLTTIIQSETDISSSDAALLTAVRNTASKVLGFTRYGTIDGIQDFVTCFEGLYPDTKIFHKAQGSRHVFIACGVASALAASWFSGKVVYKVTCDMHVFKQAEGLAALKARVFKETQCSFFFRKQVADGTEIGIVGPQERHSDAVSLINSHQHVKECLLRIPPTYAKLFDDASPMLRKRLGCRFIVEGGGKIRVVGSPESILAARETISVLCKYIAKEVQHNRLKEVNHSVMANILKVEVKVKVPPKIQEMLRRPFFNSSDRRVDEKAGGVYKRSIDEIQRRATVLWAALDGLIDEVSKVLRQENILKKNETLNVGVAAMGIRVDDYVMRGEAWQGNAKDRELKNGGRLLQELVTGKPPPIVQFKRAKVQKIEPGVQVGSTNLVTVVTDWVKCTLDPSKPDPGRPTCDVITIGWDVEGKQMRHDITCPGTRMIIKDTSEPEQHPDAHPLITLAREVLRVSYLSTVDETLLTELNRVVHGLEGSGRTQNTILERCRQRCREMGQEAASECASIVKKLDSQPKNKVTEMLKQQLEVIENEWTQACKVAEWENDVLLSKTRLLVDEEERAERWLRTAREALNKISSSTGAYLDHVSPNDYVLISGDESSVKTAVRCVKKLQFEGLEGLEEVKTVSLSSDEVQQLTENNNLVLELVQQEVGLKSAKIEGSKLTVAGTAKQLQSVLEYLGRETAHDEEDAPTCDACLMDCFGDVDEDKVLVELLCGHNVHPGCVARFMASQYALNAEEGCTTRTPCRCPVASCGYTITPNEYCTVLGTATTPLPSSLENLNTMISAYIHTQDRVRNCPTCNKWVISSSITEPICCTNCLTMFCGQRNPPCNGVPHYFSTCDQYVKARQRMNKEPDTTGGAPALPSNVVMCAKCPAWILREDDAGDDRCRYMKCRQCSYEFCWLCLIPSVDHRHVNPQNIAQSVECDPSGRDARRERLMRSHEVALWRGYVGCDRCGEVAVKKDDELYACEVCLNHYYCAACVGKGCITDLTHVVRQVALEDPPAKLTSDTMMCPGGHVLQPQKAMMQPTFSCDNCKKTGDPSFFLGCRTCDYDLCKNCASQQSRRSGGDLLAEPHLTQLDVPEEFWEKLAKEHPEVSLCDGDEEEEAVPMDVDDEQEPKKQLIDFISGSIMMQLRTLRAGGAGGLIAAMLGIQQ
eukprot:TRINITY_DN20525_c0_g3_i1.p1 TRINITY_DN20525_c0_g3~~TRINITY_DN20525_c0_g3_i1.p1  ORF type:complete len:1476 (+),score=527.71 TRINITY_DN20525_c0_g3_i1:138-4430(+)